MPKNLLDRSFRLFKSCDFRLTVARNTNLLSKNFRLGSNGHSDIFQVSSVPSLDRWNPMRFHTFKTSPQRNLLIADSQAKKLFFPNFNILSIPGAQIRHASHYIPQKGVYNTIVLFIGDNNLFYGARLTVKEPTDVAEEHGKLANELVPVAEVFVIE